MATATVRLSRKRGGVLYRHRDFPVVIDGDVVGSIVVEEAVDIPIEPGHRVLRLGSGRHRSPELTFDAAEGETIGFTCRGAAFWPQWLAALAKPDLWISL